MIFWIVIRMFSTPGLVQKVRDEIHPFAKAWQPTQVFRIPEPARLEINDAGLVQSCPLLKACLYECLRLYSKPTSVGIVQSDISVSESHEHSRSIQGEPPESFVLEAGDFVASLSNAYQHGPHYHESPDLFQPGRFLRSSDSVQERRTVVQETINISGSGEFACPGHVYSEREVLAFVAAFLVLWDLKPATSQDWIVPRRRTCGVVSLPSTDIRARLQPRGLSVVS